MEVAVESNLVSVIVPAYNRSGLLSEAIQSVISQTYRPIECIIVDDGSTDNTREVVEEIASETDKKFLVKYIFQPNAGSQVARNTGTAAATGTFIQYLDSDDILYPEKLEQQVNYLLQNENCDGVFGDWQVGSSQLNETTIAYKDDDFITQILTGRCIANFSFLMKRNIVQAIGNWDVKIKRNQEIDFHLKGLIEGANFEYQPLLCGLWRTHEKERITSVTGLRDVIQFYRKWENILKEKKKFSPALAVKIADLYMWFVTQNKYVGDKELIAILKELIRLNPDIAMNRSTKLRLARNLLGINLALKLWLLQFRRSTRAVNNKVIN